MIDGEADRLEVAFAEPPPLPSGAAAPGLPQPLPPPPRGAECGAAGSGRQPRTARVSPRLAISRVVPRSSAQRSVVPSPYCSARAICKKPASMVASASAKAASTTARGKLAIAGSTSGEADSSTTATAAAAAAPSAPSAVWSVRPAAATSPGSGGFASAASPGPSSSHPPSHRASGGGAVGLPARRAAAHSSAEVGCSADTDADVDVGANAAGAPPPTERSDRARAAGRCSRAYSAHRAPPCPSRTEKRRRPASASRGAAASAGADAAAWMWLAPRSAVTPARSSMYGRRP